MDKQREAWWNKQKNKSFCTVPWVTFAVNHNGDYRVCVQAAQDKKTKGVLRQENEVPYRADTHSLKEIRNAPLYKEMRVAMLKGEQHPACIRCKQEENAGIASRRVKDTRRYGDPKLEFRSGIDDMSNARRATKNAPAVFTLDDAKKFTFKDGVIEHEDFTLFESDIRLSNF